MKMYKPNSLEENYCNILNLRNSFYNSINSFIWEYNFIIRKYNDPKFYNQLLCLGCINPCLNSIEDEMHHLAYRIFGYTSCVFETLSYALDFWRIHTDPKQNDRNITDKEYDQAINLLSQKCKNIRANKDTLLNFRAQRNYCTHYGRIQFCNYIFIHSSCLYNLIGVMTQLLGQMNLDSKMVEYYCNQQGTLIDDMKTVLADYSQDNLIVS